MIERNLRIFRTAAAVLNFTEAAEILGMSQPNVTRQLARLERELGTMLFLRTGRSVELTPEGEVLKEECEKLFSMESGILRKLRDAAKGRSSYTLGGTVTAGSFLLIGMIAAYRRENPECALDLEIGGAADLLARLDAGELDLVLTDDVYDRKHFLCEPYCTDELIPVFAPGLIRERDLSVKEHLRRGSRFIFVGLNSGSCRAFLHYLRRRRLPEPADDQLTAAGSLDAVKQLAQSGAGIAVLSSLAVENELKAGVLLRGVFSEGPLARPVDFVYTPSGKHAFIDGFIRFCRRRRAPSLAPRS